MADESTLVYRSPGDNPGPGGRTYTWKKAVDAVALDRLLQEGWSPSLGEALKAAELNDPSNEATDALAMGTPEERLAAADQAVDKAAQKAVSGKKTAEVDALALGEAEKALAVATKMADSAEADKVRATEKAQKAALERAAAAEQFQAATKTFSSSKLWASAAQRALANAVAKRQDVQKSVDASEAAEKAIAGAMDGVKVPSEPETPETPTDDTTPSARTPGVRGKSRAL